MMRQFGKIAVAWTVVSAAALGCSGVESSNKVDVGVKVGPLGGPTTEAGGQVAFVVTLRTKPKADVILPLSSSNTAEATLGSSNQLVFTSENWQSPHTVLVTGVDDEYADGHASYEIAFGATQSADENYNGLQLASIPATNLDDETVGVVVSPSSGPTTEGGAESEFTVVLTARPQGIVSIPYASSDLTEADVDGQSVEFDGDDWNVPRAITVAGVDDGIPDGNQTFIVTLGPLFSTDPTWDGLELPQVLMVNVDDDAPGITVSAPSGATTEAGGEATFTVQLNAQPSANVILSFDSDDATEGSVDQTTLTFTTVNWATPQTVTVTGENDNAADGPVSYQVDFTATVSADGAYNGLVPTSLDLFNTDDENAAVTVYPVNGLTSESGTAATFDVVLGAQPANDVVVQARVSNGKEAFVSPSTITFTAMNWNVPVTVTVTGKNDFLADGHKAYQLKLTPTGDATYAASTPAAAFLTNLDDGPPARIVVYNDNLGTQADEASSALSLAFTVVTTQADVVTELASNPAVLIWEASSGAALDPAVLPALTSWLDIGGRLIYSDSDLDGQPAMQSLLEVTAANPYDAFRSVSPVTTLRGNIFTRGTTLVPTPLTGVNVVANENGNEVMTLTSAGTIAATFTSTSSGAIAITRVNSVIVNGFSPDDSVGANSDADAKPDMQELYENEILYLLDVPLRTFRVNSNTITPITVVNTPINAPIVFPAGEIVRRASVSFHILHTFDGDLDIFLAPPAGTAVELTTDNGGGIDNYGTGCADAQRTTFDQDAATLIPTTTTQASPFVGTFRPEGNLNSVGGVASGGTWNLRITDDASGDTGALQCWSLFLTVEDAE